MEEEPLLRKCTDQNSVIGNSNYLSWKLTKMLYFIFASHFSSISKDIS